MTGLAAELDAAGGAAAPAAATARLRELLGAALAHGREELGRSRSGYGEPVEVAFAADGGRLLAATPADAALRADPRAAGSGRGCWSPRPSPRSSSSPSPASRCAPTTCVIAAGELPGGHLVLAYPAPDVDPATLEELAPLAFDEHAGRIDRLRACALRGARPACSARSTRSRRSAPGTRCGSPRPSRGSAAARRRPPTSRPTRRPCSRCSSRPAAPPARTRTRIPANRVARRILQRLDGMGKWGGYHTDFAHLPRGFAGNDRALASEVGEALLDAGLLAEKPSVGQRHVFLNPRRAADIHRYVDDGTPPPGMRLPRE